MSFLPLFLSLPPSVARFSSRTAGDRAFVPRGRSRGWRIARRKKMETSDVPSTGTLLPLSSKRSPSRNITAACSRSGQKSVSHVLPQLSRILARKRRRKSDRLLKTRTVLLIPLRQSSRSVGGYVHAIQLGAVARRGAHDRTYTRGSVRMYIHVRATGLLYGGE